MWCVTVAVHNSFSQEMLKDLSLELHQALYSVLHHATFMFQFLAKRRSSLISWLKDGHL